MSFENLVCFDSAKEIVNIFKPHCGCMFNVEKLRELNMAVLAQRKMGEYRNEQPSGEGAWKIKKIWDYETCVEGPFILSDVAKLSWGDKGEYTLLTLQIICKEEIFHIVLDDITPGKKCLSRDLRATRGDVINILSHRV